MADFFSHMRTYPPNMADYGVMRSGTKAYILVCASELMVLVCASELMTHHDTLKPHEAHLIIPDGFADCNMIKPRTPVSFD